MSGYTKHKFRGRPPKKIGQNFLKDAVESTLLTKWFEFS